MMSRSLNRAMLIGHVGADPEVRTTAGGKRVASFSLATSRRFTAADGGANEKTDWHRVIAWDQLAELASRQVRKGGRLFVEGRVEYRSWEAADGRTRYATEVIAEEVLALDVDAPAGASTQEWRAVLRDDSPDAGVAGPGTVRPTGARRGDDELPF